VRLPGERVAGAADEQDQNGDRNLSERPVAVGGNR